MTSKNKILQLKLTIKVLDQVIELSKLGAAIDKSMTREALESRKSLRTLILAVRKAKKEISG